jgi:hypothetical protein
MKRADAKLIITFGVLFCAIAFYVSFVLDRNSHSESEISLEETIEDIGSLATADFDYPNILPQKIFKMELDGCVLRIEKTLNEQKVCANTAISDRLLVYRTEFQLSDKLKVELTNDDSRKASLLFISVMPKFRNDPDLMPIVRSGIQCDGRNADPYRSNLGDAFIFPLNSVNGLDDAIRKYIKASC